jgi:hypothetical protein
MASLEDLKAAIRDAVGEAEVTLIGVGGAKETTTVSRAFRALEQEQDRIKVKLNSIEDKIDQLLA